MMIDPEWAWASYQPSEENPWDLFAAAHLYRRAGFGASRAELEDAVEREPNELVGEMVHATEPEWFARQMQGLIKAGLATGNVKHLSAQWAYRMLNTPAPLREKMTLFWHGHFATSAAKVDDADLMQTQNDLLRQNAIGDFSKLLLEISRDPAMLLYLDSASNRKAHPNENYAREIMELFALGEGNYTEQDIRELARCFTGWEIKRKKFRFNRYQNDTGIKTVLGKTGEFSGEDGVELVVAQDASPRFLVKKLINFFVMDEPDASDGLVEPLAEKLRADEMVIAPTLKRILSSNLFFSTHARARKVRSPVDVGVGFLRSMEASTDAYQLAEDLDQLGQGLLFPPSVKGWDGGRTWVNSSTLLGRANLIGRFLDGGKTRYRKRSLHEFLTEQRVGSTQQLIDWLEASLFAVRIPDSARQQIVALDQTARRTSAERTRDVVHLLCTLPEFQLS